MLRVQILPRVRLHIQQMQVNKRSILFEEQQGTRLASIRQTLVSCRVGVMVSGELGRGALVQDTKCKNKVLRVEVKAAKDILLNACISKTRKAYLIPMFCSMLFF